MVVIPTAFDLKENSSFPVKGKINLGLDLQGGLYMVLGIDFNKVYLDELKNTAKKIQYTLQDQGIDSEVGDAVATVPDDPKVWIEVMGTTSADQAHEKVREFFGTSIRLTAREGNTLQYGLTKSMKVDIETNSVSKSIEVIRNRIDEFGVTEPEIVSQGKDRIVVQLPGVKDIDRAKSLIGRTAKLEFKIVNDEIAPGQINEWLEKAEKAGITFEKGDRFSEYVTKLNQFLKDDLPKGYEIAFQKTISKVSNELEQKIPFLVESTPSITGEDLQDARVQIDQQNNSPYVGMTFKSAGAKRFAEVTGKNVGKRLAVILDKNVYTAPVIQAKIAGGNAQITLGAGNYNELLQSAKDIALVLRAGALPVQLDFEEQRIVGPSLGADSIKKAKTASMIGAVVVFLFILIYYKVGGLIALVSLVLNVTIVMAFLVGLEATLTLPGIAGIALTVGMAVDASIIIYERIREEVRGGAGNRQAVESGFSRAFWTIVDANITTALAGLCLLNFGTGPIRGFAVTLLIGIISTVYTSYYVGNLLFELYMNKTQGKDLSI
jgi:protein-export membrane protein SecD